MPLYQVVILAIVQGLTEFLPISSTAHLHLTTWLLGWQAESLSFDIMLHVGTLLALVFYFIGDWIQIIGQGFGIDVGRDEQLKQNRGLFWLLVIGTVPIGIAGLLFHKQAEGAWRTPWVMGTMLIAVGVLMWVAENAGRRQRDLSTLYLPDALTIGAAQALAVVPGTSRSGITISAGLFRNLDREAAARFSFLLATPAIAAAAVGALRDLQKAHELPTLLSTTFVVGVAVSAITGWLVIAWFLHYLRRASFRPFVYYRIAFGVLVLILAAVKNG
jgi:undecaprenyl-diphosphatase